MTEAQGATLLQTAAQQLAEQQDITAHLEAIGRLCSIGLWLLCILIAFVALRRFIGRG